MAVAFDAAAGADTGGGGATGLSWSHTCSGTERVLYVGWEARQALTSPACTYNGVSMTLIRTEEDGGGVVFNYVFRLIAPATGANTVACTSTGSARKTVGLSVSVTGADQTTPEGTIVVFTSTGSQTPSVTLTSATGDLCLDFVTAQNTTAAADAGQTDRGNRATTGGSGGTNLVGACSTEPGAASVTMSWTLGASRRVAQIGIPIVAAAGGAPPAFIPRIMVA